MNTSTLRGTSNVPLAELIPDVKPGFAVGERDPEGVIQVRMNNVDLHGNLDIDGVIRVPATPKQVADCSLKAGDVLFNNTNSTELVGKSALFRGHSEPVTFSNHFTRLRVSQQRLDPRYLARWLTKQQRMRVFEGLCTRWVGQSAVRAEKLLALEIPLPPLPEQKRIADILDKADAIRRERREVSMILADYPLALFMQMFGHPDPNPKGWPMLAFSNVCDSRLGKMLDAKQQTGRHNRPYMRNLNVQWGRLDLSKVFEMDFDESDREEFRLQFGDVLICEGGAGVGQTAIWRDELPECYFQKSLHRVRPFASKATPEYIAFLMWTLMKRSSLLRSISSATIPHLTGEKLKDVRIPVPPLKLQQQFSAQCQRAATTTDNAAATFGLADSLFNSLVQRAFRGEL